MLLLWLLHIARGRLTEFQHGEVLVIFAGRLIHPQKPRLRYDPSFFTFCELPSPATPVPRLSKFLADEQTDIGIHLGFLEPATKSPLCTRGLTAADHANLRTAIAAGFFIEFLADGLSASAPLGAGDQYYSHWNFTLRHNGPYLLGFSVSCDTPRELGSLAPFEYSLNWVQTSETYRAMKTPNDSVEFLALAKAALGIATAGVIVAVVIGQRISRDIDSEDADEHSWKALHGHVFRAPPHCALLAASVSGGVHVLLTLLAFLSANCFLRLDNGIELALIFIACAVVSGYVSAGVLIEFGESTFRSALIFSVAVTSPPALCLAQWLLVLIVAFPCAWVGSVIGQRLPLFDDNPSEAASIPRTAPRRRCLARPAVLSLLIGAGSSATFVLQAEAVIGALRRETVAWVFRELLVTVIATIAVAGILAVVAVYLMLVRENHQWQWVAFLGPFSSALFVGAYALQYVVTRTKLTAREEILTCGLYAVVVAIVWGLACGSVGFFSANWFVRVVFSNLKIS
jgi:hypothetical protein